MNKAWLILGFGAQGLFTARFIVQWIASERAGRSVVPVTFWILSFLGGGLLFIYALGRHDPVFIVGQGCGLLIYARNLTLLYRERKKSKEAAAFKDEAVSSDLRP